MAEQGIATSGKTKADHYSWAAVGERPEFRMLPIGDIRTPDYQRGEASHNTTIDRAKSFSLASAGALIVARRRDGTHWIVDGLQRLYALRTRGDVLEVACMIFSSTGPEHEAEVFLKCNSDRSRVKARHKFAVAVEAGRHPESDIATWLSENGMRVGSDLAPGQVGFPAYVLQTWNWSNEACKEAILLTREIGEGSLHATVFKAVFHLLRNGVNVRSYLPKIIKAGGETAVIKEANRAAILSGTPCNFNTAGAGLCKIINHKLRQCSRVLVNEV